MNIKLKNKDKQTIFLAAIVIFIVIDLFIIIVGWQCRSLFKYYKAAAEKRQMIAMLENDIKNLNSYRQEISDLETSIRNLELLVTNEANISGLIENISNLANICGVKIIQVKPEVVDEDDKSTGLQIKDNKFGEIEIQLVAKADFHQLGSFISKIESEKNFFKVTSLEIETASENYMIQNIRLSLKSIINRIQINKKDLL